MLRQRLFARRWPNRSYATDAPSRIARIEARLPKFLHRYTTPLRNAPVSHISAFLILHELTAIVPLFGLAALFHYTNYLPPLISEGKWVAEGTEKFGRYLRRKGWISQADEDKAEGRSGKWFGRGEGGVRIVVELATAYAITKALLPIRLVLSVWGTPWFARWSVLPVSNLMKRVWQRRGGVTKSNVHPAAGTGAVGANVLPTCIEQRHSHWTATLTLHITAQSNRSRHTRKTSPNFLIVLDTDGYATNSSSHPHPVSFGSLKNTPPTSAMPVVSRFLALPAELRNFIYELAFEDSISMGGIQPGIVRACRQTRAESLSLFYNTSCFAFGNSLSLFIAPFDSQVSGWLQAIGQANAGQVRHLRFEHDWVFCLEDCNESVGPYYDYLHIFVQENGTRFTYWALTYCDSEGQMIVEEKKSWLSESEILESDVEAMIEQAARLPDGTYCY
ncbi:hypothetical protein LTR15_001467 [Elasticomyces elasticus]|nr:hypothetical protein LTR15_001467 [Elasticomyces elasticus]